MIRYILFVLIFFYSCSKPDETNKLTATIKSSNEKTSVVVDSTLVTKRTLKRIEKYEQYIKKYSNLYEVDWRIIVSMIVKESSFKPNAISRVGAKGLMQIMPRNEKYLESELDIDYIYERPEENIKAGVYHLKIQLDFFKEVPNDEDQMKIALASYNAGYGRLRDAVTISHYLFPDDPYAWENIKHALNRMKYRDYELHLEIWTAGKPRYGYFGNPKETVFYVEKIMELYQYFQVAFDE